MTCPISEQGKKINAPAGTEPSDALNPSGDVRRYRDSTTPPRFEIAGMRREKRLPQAVRPGKPSERFATAKDKERPEVSHIAEIRVRYHETDKMGIVHFINHFRWFEIGRTELMRSHKMSLPKLEKAGCFLILKETKCEYKSPAWYDDIIHIETKVVEVREKGVKFMYVITREEIKLAEGYTIHVCTDGAGKVKPFPEKYYKMFQEALG